MTPAEIKATGDLAAVICAEAMIKASRLKGVRLVGVYIVVGGQLLCCEMTSGSTKRAPRVKLELA